MAVQFAPKQGSFGQTLGNAVGTGLNRIIESKIEALNKEQKVQDARKWVAQAQLPEWLGDAFVQDPKTFQKFIEQWEFLPPEAQQQVRQATSNIGVEEEQPLNPQQQSMMQSEQRTPMGQQAPAGVQVPAEDMAAKEPVMSGLNKLAQAGEGYQKPVDEGSQQAQSFPSLGHGTQGQAAPFESSQPFQPQEWSEAERARGWRQKPKAAGSSGALAQEKHDLSLRKQAFAEQESVKPFLHKEAEDLKAQKQARDIAENMLKNLKKNKSRWPGAIVGNLPDAVKSVFIRDPNVRKYIADANSLVSALAGTRKGVPTNFKLKLEALSKADLSQPIEAQEEILEDVIDKYEKAKERQKFIASQRDSRGQYPLDIERRTLDFETAQDSEMRVPRGAQEGDIYEDDSGQQWEYANGKMKKV